MGGGPRAAVATVKDQQADETPSGILSGRHPGRRHPAGHQNSARTPIYEKVYFV